MNGLHFRLLPRPEELRLLRRTVREALSRRSLPEAEIDSAVLVIDEIVSNAIEHGRPYRDRDGSPHDLELHLWSEQKDLWIEFTDPDVPDAVVQRLARELAECGGQLPPAQSERGRGLYLVASGLHHLSVKGLGVQGLQLRGRLVRGS